MQPALPLLYVKVFACATRYLLELVRSTSPSQNDANLHNCRYHLHHALHNSLTTLTHTPHLDSFQARALKLLVDFNMCHSPLHRSLTNIMADPTPMKKKKSFRSMPTPTRLFSAADPYDYPASAKKRATGINGSSGVGQRRVLGEIA